MFQRQNKITENFLVRKSQICGGEIEEQIHQS